MAERVEQHPPRGTARERRAALDAQFLAELGEGEGLAHANTGNDPGVR